MDESDSDEIRHHCDARRGAEVLIRYVKINIEEWSWVLDTDWRATPAEVDQGLASEVGAVIVSDRLLIGFCPFCGLPLVDLGVPPIDQAE